ncbi:MAG: prolyl oligopeptidase family serine peptidase, partial [Cellvibrionaceae bacterium]|nr:prolyl oligopeptidase family serine peptidase [Cellvibrionaceae bacterium]
FLAANPSLSPSLAIATDKINLLIKSQINIGKKYISLPQAVSFPTSENDTAHAFYYPPTNAEAEFSAAPPMIFICHGGPTGASSTALSLKIQYWTSRGFAVMDVNFRGSTGYGRHYREKLYRRWGEIDVDDMCYAADYAVTKGWADPQKLVIKGGSAGGYTALACLCFKKTFSAGVSLYGIGDLHALTEDTHKFEAHYLDQLIGDPITERALYSQRSPINFVDNIQCPILVFQGLEDKVVPPNQAVNMVKAVEKQGIPVAYISFADEGHGFRNPSNIKTMLDAEHSFYCQIFQLPHPPELQQLAIKNL